MTIDLLNVAGGAIAGIFTAILGWFSFIKKSRTDETTLALSAWKDLLEPLQNQLAAATLEVHSLKEALQESERAHRQEVDRLIKRIRELERLVKQSNTKN